MPIFTVPIHEHGDPDRPGPYPHGQGARDAFVKPPRPSPSDALSAPYGAHAATIRKVQRELVGRTKQDGFEHLAVVWPDKPVEYFTSHDDKHIEMPRDSIFEEMQATTPVVMAHTHPASSAPSYADLRLQIKARTPRQLILGENGDWFELEVTDFEKAETTFSPGISRKTFWERLVKGPFTANFDRLKKAVNRDATKLADAWAAKRLGLTVTKQGETDGFLTPEGGFLSRRMAGALHPELQQYHTEQFANLSPRIWLTLAKKYSGWLKFRYYQQKGPYATTAAD